MVKYKNFLSNGYEVGTLVIAILFALAVFFAIAIDMEAPVDAKELEQHYRQLETIKQDITNICELENADITICENGMTVLLKGTDHNLSATFDESKNYVSAEIIDNRIGSNIGAVILITIVAFGYGYFLAYAILAVLCIPLLIHSIVMYIKKKWHAKKAK